jgi:hypothetical protein
VLRVRGNDGSKNQILTYSLKHHDGFVEVDLSFIEEALGYLSSPSSARLDKMLRHPAAKGVHSHAARFGNTEKDLAGFWEERLEAVTPDAVERAQANVGYMAKNTGGFREAFDELMGYIPNDLELRCRLYAVVGYDVGIVSDGDAYLNLGHRVYADQRELVYFAMHELHHVAYTHYQPIYSFSDLKTTMDLRRVVMYSTHLEGLAVYAAYEKRRSEDGLNHVDYRLYGDKSARDRIIKECFNIWDDLRSKPVRSFREDDFGLIERLSGDRLWYVTGLHMAKNIDERLGRETLTETIKAGPNSFFEAYESAR